MKPHEKQQEKLIILINFKRVSGDRASRLAAELDKIDGNIRNSFDIIIALQPRDALRIAGEISLPVFIQEGFADSGDLLFDGIDTGLLSPGNLRGIILSHPERKVPVDVLEERTAVVRELGLEIILCATSLDEGVDLHRRFEPGYLAVENEQLIGKDISLCDYCPEMVEEVTRKINNRILFGGGIRSHRDIHWVSKNGGSGVLLSSLVLKSPDPLATLIGLLNPLSYVN